MENNETLFYIGDPCYVLTESEYDTLCATADLRLPDNEDYDPEVVLDTEDWDWEIEGSGRPCYVFPTAYGDGLIFVH